MIPRSTLVMVEPPAMPSLVTIMTGSSGRGKKARQGLRACRPTRPAGPTLHLAGPSIDGPTRDNGLDFTLARSAAVISREFRPGKPLGLPQGTGRAEPDIVVVVRRLVPVANGRADIHRLVVERAATPGTANRSLPSGRRLYREVGSAGDRCWLAGRGRSNWRSLGECRQRKDARQRSPLACGERGAGISRRSPAATADASE